MTKNLLILLLSLITSSCWPGPSYSDKDPRCKSWLMEYFKLNETKQSQKELTKKLNVNDRYHYYICLQGMGTYTPNEDIFLDDAEEFFKSVPTLLNGKIPGYQLYFMTKICYKIAQNKPALTKKYMSSLDAIEAYADTVKDDGWKYDAIYKIRYIRYSLAGGDYFRVN